jgi:Deoxyribodipyrimidine photolyase
MTKKTIVWFRHDLRLADNPALFAAASQGQVIAIYIHDETSPGIKLGRASRWWLHHSLIKLNTSLQNKLNIYQGVSKAIILALVKSQSVDAVYWNRCYEPWRIPQDTDIKTELQHQGIDCRSFNASLLWEPWDILKKDGLPYKVFTPFYQKGCLSAEPPRDPLPSPETFTLVKDPANDLSVDHLNLLPTVKWYRGIEQEWVVGESAAHKKLGKFLQSGLENYEIGRNFPAQEKVSRLSPHLHFGEISAHQIYFKLRESSSKDSQCFCRELGWREFSYYLLYHFPNLPTQNFQKKFDRLVWQDNPVHLAAWQQGKTGFPLIDAGMRQLWQTGYMHNRVRMVVGSFLVKNLLLDWRQGANWFWDCLVDADLANNSMGWQWVAGSGADAAPYFRIFNPVTQGEKFDPQGDYTKHFLPELSRLPINYLFKPWEAPAQVLSNAGIILGETYPKPIVDLAISRQYALAAFRDLGNYA